MRQSSLNRVTRHRTTRARFRSRLPLCSVALWFVIGELWGRQPVFPHGAIYAGLLLQLALLVWFGGREALAVWSFDLSGVTRVDWRGRRCHYTWRNGVGLRVGGWSIALLLPGRRLTLTRVFWPWEAEALVHLVCAGLSHQRPSRSGHSPVTGLELADLLGLPETGYLSCGPWYATRRIVATGPGIMLRTRRFERFWSWADVNAVQVRVGWTGRSTWFVHVVDTWFIFKSTWHGGALLANAIARVYAQLLAGRGLPDCPGRLIPATALSLACEDGDATRGLSRPSADGNSGPADAVDAGG